MAVVAIFALRYALKSARTDAGIPADTWFTLGSACTPDVIYRTAGTDPQQFTI